jgi:uncharacterized protein
VAARRKKTAGAAGLLLAPGAGSDRNHSCLVAVEAAVAPLPVRRMDFPYRKAGKKAPDRAPVLLAAMRAEIDEFTAEVGAGAAGRLVLGGRSMGGRMATMLAAGDAPGAAVLIGERVPVAGLALISYPLHPPGKPENLRTEHLPRLSVPCLFVHGTRDPFGTPDELTAATALVPGPVTHVWIEGGRHELAKADERVAAAVTDWLATL